MRKLLIGLVVLGSISAYAVPSFELDLESSSTILRESKNYESRHVNQDLSVSIVKPKFSNPTGDGALYLSMNSDLDGVCKLYGLKSYVQNSSTILNLSSGRSVNINESGAFRQFDDNSRRYAIQSLACIGDAKPVPVSDNFIGKYLNDDDSFTIKTPKFMMSGENLNISIKSDLKGVCKLYGFSSYVIGSLTYQSLDSTVNVEISSSSRFRLFSTNNSNLVINSLMCR